MPLERLAGDRQAEPQAAGLGGDERLERPGDLCARQARALVLDLDQPTVPPGPPRAQLDFATMTDASAALARTLFEQLAQDHGCSPTRGSWSGRSRQQSNALALESGPILREGSRDHGTWFGRRIRSCAGSGRGEILADPALQAIGLGHDLGEQGTGIRRGLGLEPELGRGADRGHRIAQAMGDRGRHLAGGGQFLRCHERRLLQADEALRAPQPSRPEPRRRSARPRRRQPRPRRRLLDGREQTNRRAVDLDHADNRGSPGSLPQIGR